MACATTPYTIPGDGATAVPANVRLYVSAYQPTEPVTLIRASDGTSVPLELEDEVRELQWDKFALRPSATLELGVYEIHLGPQLLATFATATELDETAPAFTGLTGFAARRWRNDGTWGSECLTTTNGLDDLRLDGAVPEDAVGMIVTLRKDGDPATIWRTIRPPSWHTNFSTCDAGQVIALEAGVRYCARMSVFDVAGNEAGGDVEVCGTTEECFLSLDLDCGPLIDTICGPDPDPPAVDPPVPTDDGGGCTVGSAGGRPVVPLTQVVMLVAATAVSILGRRRR